MFSSSLLQVRVGALCTATVLLGAGVRALDNGFRTPQMGYNSWYDVFMSPSFDLMKQTVDAMVSQGLVELGYVYANLDDGWNIGRNASGVIQVDETLWPGGIAALMDYIHSNGMKGGVYGDRGNKTCGGRVGQYGHQVIDANTFAAWGVDYFKEDSCGAPQDHQSAYAEYATMRDALNATGRPIFFSLCGWENWYAPVGRSLGNSWRIGGDDTNWHGVLSDIDDMAPLWPYAGAGGINDPCLLLGNDMNNQPAVTELQSRAQFSMWAVMMAPLLLSQNVRNLSANRLETYMNKEVIAVNQDDMHRQGMRLWGGPLSLQRRYTPAGNIPVTVQPCGSPAPSVQTWVWNVSGPGYISNPTSSLCFNLDDCNTDVIAFPCVTSGGTCCGADCYANQQFYLGADGTLRSQLDAGQCVTSMGKGVQASLSPCAGLASQQWKYDSPTSTLRSPTGECLQAGGNSSVPLTNVWGRPLKDGSWALVFINVDYQPYNITCDFDSCISATGMDADTVVSVRDLWAHQDMGTQTIGAGFTSPTLPPEGGVYMLRITPQWNATAATRAATSGMHMHRGAANKYRNVPVLP